jgi:hypothetical protein
MTDLTEEEINSKICIDLEYLNLQPIDRSKLTDSIVSSNIEVKLSALPV